MIANQMYNIDLPTDETFLSSSKNMMAIATIFQQAIFKFKSIYQKKEIPLSFIDFYINEIRNYSYMFRKQTKEFFDMYDRIGPNIELIANIYLKSYFSQCTHIKKKKNENELKSLNEQGKSLEVNINTITKQIEKQREQNKKLKEEITQKQKELTKEKQNASTLKAKQMKKPRLRFPV